MDWLSGDRILYMALGKYNQIRYIGLSECANTRFGNHPKIHDPDNFKFFIGEIVTRAHSGRRKSKGAPDLASAERTLISYFKPTLNDRLKEAYIDDDVSITSYFFSHWEDEELLTPRPLPKFPTLLSYSYWGDSFFVGG